MRWSAFLSLAALLAPQVQALIRFACSQLVIERSDPLVTPGRVSPHLHQIIGGNAFNLTMDKSLDLPKLATCTTCKFKEDLSNYWTAVMFFKHRNGSFTQVPLMANQVIGNPNGGMTVYYLNNGNAKTKTFPPGFRMIVGDPTLRTLPQRKALPISFRCFGANFKNDPNWQHPGTGPLDTVELPKGKCLGGIRSNIFFPSCWNGKDLDPPDHSSHVTYLDGAVPRDGYFFMEGTCPASHPVRVPMLFLEIMWDTRKFNDMEWPTDGSQPFVMSYGDPTGIGQHADYVFGWKGDSLQKAMDSCSGLGGAGCSPLTSIADAEMNKCTQPKQVQEDWDGYRASLPGCNPVQAGPGPATMPPCNLPTPPVVADPPLGGSLPAPTPQPTQPQPTQPPPPIPTVQPTPPTQPAPPGTIPKFGQCGGLGWAGATQCVAGTTCTPLNDFYHQCI